MRNLSKKQTIAVFVSIGFISYVFFGESIINFFNSSFSSSKQQPKMEETARVTKQDLVLGEGIVASQGDVLTVHYVGRLTDGRVFDSSVDRNVPFDFTLGVGQVIRGWDEGLMGMQVGGKRVLTISPEYAYGSKGIGSIPPNSTLVFEVELLDVKKSQ